MSCNAISIRTEIPSPKSQEIAAGLPLSGIIGREEIFDPMLGGTIGRTYVSNLIACRAGIEVLNIIEEEKLLDRAVAMGEVIRERFEEMKHKYAIVGDVCGPVPCWERSLSRIQ